MDGLRHGQHRRSDFGIERGGERTVEAALRLEAGGVDVSEIVGNDFEFIEPSGECGVSGVEAGVHGDE